MVRAVDVLVSAPVFIRPVAVEVAAVVSRMVKDAVEDNFNAAFFCFTAEFFKDFLVSKLRGDI